MNGRISRDRNVYVVIKVRKILLITQRNIIEDSETLQPAYMILMLRLHVFFWERSDMDLLGLVLNRG